MMLCGIRNVERIARFTLVELLVVIAIIAVLASLLLPSLQRAKSVSYKLVCSGSLKQVGAAFQMYVNDWYGWMPDVKDPGYGSADFDASHCWFDRLNEYVKNKKIFTECREKLRPGTCGPYGVWYYWANVAYGYNRYVSGLNYGEYHKLTEVKNPSAKFLFGDSVNNQQQSNVFGLFLAYLLTAGGYPDYRHLLRANFVYVDGHCGDRAEEGGAVNYYRCFRE